MRAGTVAPATLVHYEQPVRRRASLNEGRDGSPGNTGRMQWQRWRRLNALNEGRDGSPGNTRPRAP